MTHTEPIVRRAKWMVRCECGFAHDSAQQTAEAAIAEVSATHPTPHADAGFIPKQWFTAEAYP